jgi:hypothetical protein
MVTLRIMVFLAFNRAGSKSGDDKELGRTSVGMWSSFDEQRLQMHRVCGRLAAGLGRARLRPKGNEKEEPEAPPFAVTIDTSS